MSDPGTAARPLRVAIVGAGPAGFYVAEHLLRRAGPRGGRRPVRPAAHAVRPRAGRGGARSPEDQGGDGGLRQDRRPSALPLLRRRRARQARERRRPARPLPPDRLHDRGADRPAHGHPRRGPAGQPPRDRVRRLVQRPSGLPGLQFDLTQERVAVVGVGNVAVDVARILCRTPEELAKTDIAEHALEALRASRVREVYLLGRRGAAQAAFTNPEIKELGELAAADVVVKPEEVELDALSRASLEKSGDRAGLKKVEILQSYAQRPGRQAAPARHPLPRLAGGAARRRGGAVGGIRLVRNRLVASATGTIQAKADGSVRGAAGRARVPLGRLSRRAAAGRALRRQVGRRAEREGPRARPGHRASRAAASTRRAGSSAGPTRRHRHQQARRRRDGAGDAEDLAAGHTLAPDGAGSRRRWSGSSTSVSPQYVSLRRLAALNELELARGRARGRPRAEVHSRRRDAGGPREPRTTLTRLPR